MKYFLLSLFRLDTKVNLKDMQLTSSLLYTSDAADEEDSVDLGGRRIIKKNNNNKKKNYVVY